ncbi:FAD-dependent oxidoreductase [Devosia sp. A369]
MTNQNRQENPSMELPSEVDMLVFGSGAAGLTAALVGAAKGLSVLVCEKDPTIGGTTATSGGTAWIPGAKNIARAGHKSDPVDARRYLQHELGHKFSAPHIDAFLQSGPEAIEWLENNSEVVFDHALNPDYHADAPYGSTTGHAITARAFDGRQLGDDFYRISAPRKVFMVLGGLMVGRREIPIMLRPFASPARLFEVTALILRHFLSRLTHKRGTRLLIGNALVARYFVSLRRLGVPIHTSTPLQSLVHENGRAVGAVVTHKGQEVTIRARHAVVLACGGTPHNQKLLKDISGWPHPPHLSMANPSNTGDGIQSALGIGAVADRTIENPGFWSPASVRRKGSQDILWVHGHMDRGKPGFLAVDWSGRRFTNEAESYHDVVMAMIRHGATPAWFICDHGFIRKFGLGLVRPLISPLWPFIRDGYLVRGTTIAELATKIGVPAHALEATIKQYNTSAETGVDEFGRGTKALNTFNGDPDVKPNPCLAPVVKGPFYAIKAVPATIGTTVGLATDPDARVLDEAGKPIDGLYACGNDMAAVMRGFYPGPGTTIGPAIAFAYRAAQHAAAKSASIA